MKESLTEHEHEIVLACVNTILDSSLIEDWEFQTRLGFNQGEVRLLLTSSPLIADEVSGDTEVALNNCLNEICHGVSTDDATLEKRFGLSRTQVKQVYNKWLTRNTRDGDLR